MVYEYLAEWHVGEPWSHFFFWGPCLVSVCAVLFALMRLYAARARSKTAKHGFSRDLADVGDTYVKGTVELARDASFAVRVEVLQQGRVLEAKRKQPRDRWDWKEISREVFAEPFYLRQKDGSRVRVEPGTTVLLVDALDALEHVDVGKRCWIAELKEGEQAVVEGLVSLDFDPEGKTRDLRGSPEGLVVRPEGEQPMRISAQAMDKEHDERAKAWRHSFVLAALALSVLCAANVGYLVRLGGQPGTAVVVDKQVKQGKNTKHYVRYRDERDRLHRETVSGSDHYKIKKGQTLAIRRAGSRTTLGSEHSIDFRGVLLGLVACAGALAFALYLLRGPWYRGRLNSREHDLPPWSG